MSLLFFKISLCQNFKVHAIMSQKRLAIRRRKSQLLRIGTTKLPRLLRSRSTKTPDTNKARYQHINVFIQLKIYEELIQCFSTSGSSRSSGVRLRSIKPLISS